MEEGIYVPHHKQKIVLVLSAMRYFADELRQRGVPVDYVRLDAPNNIRSWCFMKSHRAEKGWRPSSDVRALKSMRRLG